MRLSADRAIVTTILGLSVGALACVAWDAYYFRKPLAQAHEFQELVGGLGLGPELDLSQCAKSFDPRISGHCSYAHGPLPPGKDLLCPRHTTSVFRLRFRSRTAETVFQPAAARP